MLHVVTTGAYYPPVCSYYLEDFDYRSILVDSGIIVHCTKIIGSIPEGKKKITSTRALQGVHFGQGTGV